MKMNFFSDGMHNNIKKYHDYIIWIFRNIRGIFDSQANITLLEY
jgi:hypothetical protein